MCLRKFPALKDMRFWIKGPTDQLELLVNTSEKKKGDIPEKQGQKEYSKIF